MVKRSMSHGLITTRKIVIGCTLSTTGPYINNGSRLESLLISVQLISNGSSL
jgi:hypothetical protein